MPWMSSDTYEAERATQQAQTTQAREYTQDVQTTNRLMQGMPQGLSPQERLARLASGLMDSGRVNAALDVANKMTQMEQQRASTQRTQEQTMDAYYDRQLKMMGMIGDLATGVTDDASWKQANETFEKAFGIQSPLKNQPYNAKMIEYLKNYSPIYIQRLKNEMELRRLQNSERSQEERERHDRAMEDISVHKEAQREEDRKSKANKGVKTATPQELKMTDDVLKNQYPQFRNPALRDMYANEAKSIQAQKGTNFTEALQEAIQLNPPQREVGEKGRPSYTRKPSATAAKPAQGGKTPATAIPLPPNPTAKTLEVGNYYTLTYKGQRVTARWNGKELEY